MHPAYRRICLSTLIFISLPTGAKCAASAPTTGLGACIDRVAASSDLATRQIVNLGYRFSYGQGSYIDYVSKTIYIQSYDCSAGDEASLRHRLSALAHELGHAEYGVRQDTTSRTAYIQSWCDTEGYAVINNMRVRTEILACSQSSTDIGLSASNPAELLHIHSTSKESIRDIGRSFCLNNFTSTTGQNYIEYYGRYYDANY